MEQHKVKDVNDSFADVQESVIGKYKQAVARATDYVSENPWKAIAVTATIGTLIGLLTARR